ncbi:6101_t:CDS:2, partial [Gigaspora margarita]
NIDEISIWFNMAGNLIVDPKEKIWPTNTSSPLADVVVWFRTKDQIKARLYSENTDLAIIPGSLTSIYQLLNVCINKPFKDKLHNYWHKWMANDGNGLAK